MSAATDVLLLAPPGASSFVWAGETYRVDGGLVIVPCAAVNEAKSHGFDIAPEGSKFPPKPKK